MVRFTVFRRDDGLSQAAAERFRTGPAEHQLRLMVPIHDDPAIADLNKSVISRFNHLPRLLFTGAQDRFDLFELLDFTL